jgi:hypothetical protein
MTHKEVLKKYAYYYSVLQNIGSIPLQNDIVLATDTGVDRKEIQMAYNDIKKFKFKGSIMDYLLWLSSAFLVYEAKKDIKSFEKGHIPKMALAFFDEVCAKNKADDMNMLRLFNKNPDYLLTLFEEIFFEEKFEPFDVVEAYTFIIIHRTMLYFREKKMPKKIIEFVKEANSAQLATLYKLNRLSMGLPPLYKSKT